jgi:hypothetical protein
MRGHDELLKVRGLLAAGHADREIARTTGIPRRTIAGWRRGEVRSRDRTQCTAGLTSQHDFSKLDPQAYAYLLGLYLGDGYISEGRRGVWCLRITLDAAYPGIIDACAAALEAIFPTKTAHHGGRRESRCVDVSMWSKHWPCFFPQHGPGRKHTRPIHLRPWQKTIVDGHREAFIRGLIHSDGCRIIATERKGSYMRRAPRYAFSNKSEDIKALFCESCDALGIHWTRASDRQIAIYRKESVARVDEFVGPKR